MPKAWPTAGDYTEALQHPRLCFTDPELQTGQVNKKLMGMPCGSDGNAAIVFELRCASSTYAIKCFKRAVTDRQQHYSELSQRLGQISSPYLTQFEYLSDVVRVRGQLFPAVRMEWVSPDQLGQFVGRCISQKQSLFSLVNNFRSLVNGIECLGIIHGDLQHGNVLVEPSGALRLIDYDGMCVLPLPKVLPEERGHSNYQHPERLRSGYYKENTDAFSAQVIYLSLLAIEADSTLWKDFNNGENLILTSNDFSSPGQTPLWNRLHQSPDTEVRRLTAQLEQECRGPVSTVASLAALTPPVAAPASAFSTTSPALPWYQQQAPSTSSHASPLPTANIPTSPVPHPPVFTPVTPQPPSQSQPVAPPVPSSTGTTRHRPVIHPTTTVPPVSPWLTPPASTTPVIAQARWDDNASRNLRLIIIGAGLVALLVAAGVIFFMPKWLSRQQQAVKPRVPMNTMSR